MCNKANPSFENQKKQEKKKSIQLFFEGIQYKLPECCHAWESLLYSAIFNLIYQAS